MLLNPKMKLVLQIRCLSSFVYVLIKTEGCNANLQSAPTSSSDLISILFYQHCVLPQKDMLTSQFARLQGVYQDWKLHSHSTHHEPEETKKKQHKMHRFQCIRSEDNICIGRLKTAFSIGVCGFKSRHGLQVGSRGCTVL